MVNTPDGTQMAFIHTDCFVFFWPSFSKHIFHNYIGSKGLEETLLLLHFFNKLTNIFQQDIIFNLSYLIPLQIDYYCRLDCLWKNKFKKEHEQFETMENVNRLLLENVLPAHVAAYFIGEKRNEVCLISAMWRTVNWNFCDVEPHANKHTEGYKVLHSLPLVCNPGPL